MIDFQNGKLVKLVSVDNDKYEKLITPILADGENMVYSFKGVRDGVVFTNKRVIAINVQGVTGTKKDISSLPYSKIQAFSVETAGVLDLDSELELWFSGMGKVKFEFVADANVTTICQFISQFVLQ